MFVSIKICITQHSYIKMPEKGIASPPGTTSSPPDSERGDMQELSLERQLSTRQAQMIAMGGTIGTGLFVSSGQTLALGGPAFLVGSYTLMSILIYFVVKGVIETATHLPLAGGTMNYYGTRYVSRSLGFSMGWLYFYSFGIFVPFELTAASLVINYWNPDVNQAVWITIMLVLVVLLNILPVRVYGEAEFWCSTLKIILILGLLILSFILFWGGGPSHDRLGFRYWDHPGAIKPYLVPGSAGQFVAALATLISCVLPFTFSPEMLVVCAGEMKKPRKNLPRMANSFFWRLVLFYVGGTIAISVICPSDASQLTSGDGDDAGSSPWVVGIQNAGIRGLDSVVNAGIIIAAFSSGNSFLYLASRSLYSLALTGDAPAIFRKCNRHGTPIYAVLVSCVFTLLAYMNINNSSAVVFDWLLNLINTGGFISWICCAIVVIRFREARRVQGVPHPISQSSHLKVLSIGTWVTLVLFSVLCLLNGFTVFFPSEWSASSFLTAYIGIPLFLVVYFAHRFMHRSDPWAFAASDVDLRSKMEEFEEDNTNGNTQDNQKDTGSGWVARGWKKVINIIV
jgi:yeast amino acid transporter